MILWPRDSTPTHTSVPQRGKINDSDTCLSSAVPHSPKEDTTRRPWVRKPTVVWTYKGIFFSHKKKWSADTGDSMDGPCTSSVQSLMQRDNYRRVSLIRRCRTGESTDSSSVGAGGGGPELWAAAVGGVGFYSELITMFRLDRWLLGMHWRLLDGTLQRSILHSVNFTSKKMSQSTFRNNKTDNY